MSSTPRAAARHQAFERRSAMLAPLVERGLVTQAQLDAALAEEGASSPEALLMERHDVPKRELGEALARFYRCPFLEFDPKLPVARGLVADISPQYLRRSLWAPLWEDGAALHVVAYDPRSASMVQDIQLVFPGKAVRAHVALREDVLRFIDRLLVAVAPEGAPAAAIDAILGDIACEAEAPAEPEAHESDGVIVRLVNRIILDACAAGASDIHVEPYPDKDMVVRFRVDGECRIYKKIPARYRRAVAARVKIMAGLDIAERRKPQDGKLSFRLPERVVELRAATLPTVGGNEDLVLRVLSAGEPVPLDRLGLSSPNCRELKRMLGLPHGILLCVGPTGSGKTTTLHSALAYLNGPDMKIWTAEDPVEITQYGLRQVQVQPRVGLTFAAVLRSFLRADPDVIMVGEMRDQETAGIAVSAALTGHLVLSTLHTNSAAETVTRLLEMGIDPFHCSDALLGVLAQRLLRRLCESCRRPYHPPEPELSELGLPAGATLYRASGCAACGESGYRGRVGVHELLSVNEDIRRLIRARACPDEILRCARAAGMRTLAQDGLSKCLSGATDLAELRGAVGRAG